jgi:uncharacterized protein (DUF885 family)
MHGTQFPRRLSRRDFLKLALSSGAVTLASLLEACRGVKSSTPTRLPTWTPADSPVPNGTPTKTLPPTFTSMPTKTITYTATTKPTIILTPIPTSTPTWTPTVTPESLTAGLEDLDFDAFLDESVRRLFLRDPEGITIGGLADLLGVREDRLTDVSDSYIRETQKLQSEILDLLRKYDKALFTPDQALNARIYEWSLDDLVRGFPFMYNDYLVMPFLNSLNWSLQYLFTEAQPLDTLQDAQDYITRLQQVDVKFEQVLEGLKRREVSGVILPRIIIPDLIDNLKQYTGFIDSQPYYITLVKKALKINGLGAADKQTLLDQAKKVIKESVIPGYQSLIDYFNYLTPIAPKEVGLWRFSNGVDYYTHLLRHYTTTENTAEDIHQLGLEHVARIQAEMREAFGELGYNSTNESLGALVDRLGEDEGYVSGDVAEAAFQAAIDQAIGMLDQAFDTPLKDQIVVRGGEEGNYFVSSPLDGSRPPVFYAATAYEQPVYPIKDIAFHEAVPGHGYQFDVVQQLNLPLFRTAFQYDAYVEGWALYAERLMWELGVYDDDPAGNIGRLWLELLRAVRCVLDTAIHAKKWTYDQAIQYIREAMGLPGVGEVRRYIMWPAQATSYYIGYLKILELRQAAKDRLGSKFDLKQFHRVLLGSGQVPLSLLEQQVGTYITTSV